MFFTFLNFYILLSLSIRFNCLWNVVSLWLWVASDLSFFVFVFMEFCWFVVVGYFGFKFFCFFFFSLKISTFSSSSFVVKFVAKKNHEIYVIRFSFSLFFVCNFYWIFGFLGFFYLVLILGLL